MEIHNIKSSEGISRETHYREKPNAEKKTEKSDRYSSTFVKNVDISKDALYAMLENEVGSELADELKKLLK